MDLWKSLFGESKSTSGALPITPRTRPAHGDTPKSGTVSDSDSKLKNEKSISKLDQLALISSKDFKVCLASNPETRFFVPYIKVSIVCHSEMFDRVSEMSLFVLECLHRGVSIDSIKSITALPNVVDEELCYLKDLKLVSDVYIPTYLGDYYCELNRVLRPLYSGVAAYLNLISMNIELLVDRDFVDSPSDSSAYILTNQDIEERSFQYLLRNENRFNSLSIMRQICSSTFDAIDSSIDEKIRADILSARDQVLDSLYTTLKVESFDDVKYRMFKLEYNSPPKIGHNFYITTQVIEYTITPKSVLLDKYRHDLESLATIDHSSELLSAEGKRLLDEYVRERTLTPYTALVNRIVNHPVYTIETEIREGSIVCCNEVESEIHTPDIDGIRYEIESQVKYTRIGLDFSSLIPLSNKGENNE